MIPEGYVLLARKIRKSPLWLSLKATHRIVMIELILQAQFKDGDVVRNGEIIHLKRGQIATSYQQLVNDIGDKEVTVKVVRNAINKLIKHGFLAKDEAKARAKKGLLLTIVNYDIYQTPENYKGKGKGEEKDNEGAKRGQSEGKEGAINNNDNNAFNNDFNNGIAATEPRLNNDEIDILLNEYVQLRGSGFIYTQNDVNAAKKILSSGIPLQDALQYMRERMQSYIPKYPGDKINSLNYCVGYILDRYYKEKAKEGANNVLSINRGSYGRTKSQNQPKPEPILGEDFVGRVRRNRA
jgi:hypothetical protein